MMPHTVSNTALDSLVALGAVTGEKVVEVKLLLTILLVSLLHLVPSVLLILRVGEMERMVAELDEASAEKCYCYENCESD